MFISLLLLSSADFLSPAINLDLSLKKSAALGFNPELCINRWSCHSNRSSVEDRVVELLAVDKVLIRRQFFDLCGDLINLFLPQPFFFSNMPFVPKILKGTDRDQ